MAPTRKGRGAAVTRRQASSIRERLQCSPCSPNSVRFSSVRVRLVTDSEFWLFFAINPEKKRDFKTGAFLSSRLRTPILKNDIFSEIVRIVQEFQRNTKTYGRHFENNDFSGNRSAWYQRVSWNYTTFSYVYGSFEIPGNRSDIFDEILTHSTTALVRKTLPAWFSAKSTFAVKSSPFYRLTNEIFSVCSRPCKT